MKGVMWFGKKGKLSLRYISPYQSIKNVRNLAFELEQPPELVAIHPVFYISMLKKCLEDPQLVVLVENIGVKDNLSYKKVPIQILDWLVRKLRTKEIASVKVLWRN